MRCIPGETENMTRGRKGKTLETKERRAEVTQMSTSLIVRRCYSKRKRAPQVRVRVNVRAWRGRSP